MKTKISALPAILFLVATAQAQYYSETMRQRLQGLSPQESLFLPTPPPNAPAPPNAQQAVNVPPPPAFTAQPAPPPPNLLPDNLQLDNSRPVADNWVYQPEPYVANLPPHLTRFMGMLLYYTNGSVYIVYPSENSPPHLKGLQKDDRILSINGKSVAFYKEHFLDELNEVRAERNVHIHALMGEEKKQRIMILPNTYVEDKDLDQLCLKLSLGDKGMWSMDKGPAPTLMPSPAPNLEPQDDPARTYRRSRRQFFDPILNSQPAAVDQTGMPVAHGKGQLLEMFGMTLAHNRDKLEVLKVAEGTAADNARVKVGDEIIQLGERSTMSLKYDEITRLGRETSLLVGWKTGRIGRTKFGKFHKRRQPRH